MQGAALMANSQLECLICQQHCCLPSHLLNTIICRHVYRASQSNGMGTSILKLLAIRGLCMESLWLLPQCC